MEDNFGQPLPEVCGKILRDLERDERDLLRTAALLTAFDPGMLHAGCPHVPDSALSRFTSRPFLEMDPDRSLPYSLHSTLRDAIREADVNLRDSWSPRERAEVAARIGSYLNEVTASSRQVGDRAALAAAVAQAVSLCQLTGQFFDWLPEAAQQLLTSGGWGLVPDLSAGSDGPIRALVLGLQGARERRSGELGEAIELMNAAMAQPGLPSSLRRFLLLHRAHALRVAGRYPAAADDYRELWQDPGDFKDDAGYWLADYSFLDGRFSDALTGLDLLTDVPAELRGEVLRLRGHIYRVNALFDQAEARYREAPDLAQETGNLAAEGKALTDLAQTVSWCRPAEEEDLQARAVEANEALGNQVEIVKLHAASAVAGAKLGSLAEAGRQIRAGFDVARRTGYRGGLVWCLVAQAFSQLTSGGLDGAAATAAELADTVRELRGNRFWSEIVSWWIEPTAGRLAGTPATGWLDGTDAARARWLAARPSSAASGVQEPA